MTKKTAYDHLEEDTVLGDDSEAPKESFKYGLGSEVEDKITGYRGLLVGRTEWLYGCRRYVIQSKEKKDGVPVKPLGVDEDSLKLIKAENNPKGRFKYELGSKARCLMTGFQGTIIGRTEWLYDSTRYNLQPQELHNGEPIAAQGVTELGLELVTAAEPHKMKATGGPGREPAGPPQVSR
jgi:heat shock protein HspQ